MWREMSGVEVCAATPFGRTVWISKSSIRFQERELDMTGAISALSRRLRLMGAAITLGAASMLFALVSAPASARGPRASPTSPRR